MQTNSKWKLDYHLVLIFAFFVILFNILFFKNWSVNFIFLFSAFLTIILFFFFLRYFNIKWSKISKKRFEFRLFFISLFIRLVVMIFLYILFYYITGRSFSVEAMDSISYHESGIKLAEQLSNGYFHPLDLDVGRIRFDDIGYPMFLSIIYYIFGPSVLLIRIIHCILSSFSVLLIYKITIKLWNESISRLAGVIAMLFPAMLFYVGTHLKETYMLFLVLISIYYSIKLFNENNKLFSMIIMVISIINIFLLRNILALIIIFSIIFYYFINIYRFPKRYKVSNFICIFLLFICLYGVLSYVGLSKNISETFLSYIGIEKEGDIGRRGKSIVQFQMRGQNYAKYASPVLLSAISLITPFPSMVKTNIRYFNQTEQWYHIGGLFIWNYISFFAFIGIYYSIREKFKDSSILLSVSFGYLIALIASIYITSIRFNLIKMALFIIFVAVGYSKIKRYHIKYWYLYAIFVSFIILIWNYVKIAGRGYL